MTLRMLPCRRLSGRRRSSSEMLDSGSESSDSEDELQSRGAEFTVQQAAPESRMHRCVLLAC